MNPADLTAALKSEAARLGFELSGACPAVRPPGLDHFYQWLQDGFAGRMHYLDRRAEAYQHPRHVLDSTRSILVLATNYRTVEPIQPAPGQARMARYAWGNDYHDRIHRRLQALVDLHQRLVPNAAVRGVVDTAPLLEREFAQLAGLGWIGKNTLLLNRHLGSWLFLAAVLTSEELLYDAPGQDGYCGTCRACLDACPTGALVEPYRLDARRCLSYLTIELSEPIEPSLRPALGDRLFGCDRCQEVCPFNRRGPVSPDESFQPRPGTNPVELAELFSLDDEAFRRRFRHTPLWRAKRRGVLRNAAIVLGNRPTPAAMPALLRGLNDAEPMIRGACVWALKRFDTDLARQALARRLAVETDPDVQREIRDA